MAISTSRKVAGAVAATAALSLILGAGSVTAATAAGSPLKLGALVPTTGALAFLAAPEVAGYQMAVDDINAAGGVNGQPVQIQFADSSDTNSPNVAPASVNTLLTWGATVIGGAASSGVSKEVIDNIVAHKVVEISPANTSPDFTTWKDNGYYFRTAPSDFAQGSVIANQIATDGNRKVAIIYQDSSYGNGLEGKANSVLKAKGVTVTGTFKFTTGETNFSSVVDSALASGPQAILLISYDEAKKAIPALQAKKFAGNKIYFVDGNIADYSKETFASYISGAKGTLPGAKVPTSFQNRLIASYAKHNNGAKLTEQAYGAESYDAFILAALAAQQGKATDGTTIRNNLTSVSTKGTVVTSFAAGLKALKAGKDIDYNGFSGPVEFDKNGDPAGASIGVYQYGADGTYATHLLKVVAANAVK